MRIGVVLMKKGRLVNDLDKRCANTKRFAHPTLAMIKRLHEGLNITYESFVGSLVGAYGE